jgi:hypothetical protein
VFDTNCLSTMMRSQLAREMAASIAAPQETAGSPPWFAKAQILAGIEVLPDGCQRFVLDLFPYLR